jgi:hypothetical protein
MIADHAVETLQNFTQQLPADQPFFLAVGFHKVATKKRRQGGPDSSPDRPYFPPSFCMAWIFFLRVTLVASRHSLMFRGEYLT